MALSNDELLQVENYLSSKGIHCDDAGTTVDTADKVLAINASKAGKYYTILQLIEKAIDSGKATFYTESEIDSKVETINSSISSEASTRASEDASLSSAISSEASTRASEDASLSSAISSEATARENADTTLQSNINSVANARPTTTDLISVFTFTDEQIATIWTKAGGQS